MKALSIIAAVVASAALTAVFAFWFLAIWTGDARWPATAIASFFLAVVAGIAAFLTYAERDMR